MPRRSLVLILAVAVLSYVCYQRADRSPFGRYFAEILDQIDRHYVEPVDDQKLFEGAVKGMVERLDDHSGFTTRADTLKFQEELNQKFGGIGIELDIRAQQLTVMSPVVGTPAYAAGIRSGDRIVAIDGQSTAGLKHDDAVRRLRGDPGQRVTLSVVHAGQTVPVDFELTRAVIKIDSVLGDVRLADDSWDFFLPQEDHIGYLRIVQFGEQTFAELQAALGRLSQNGARALVLDLRNNPGGLLDAATDTCDLFIDQGAIVSTRGRDGQVRKQYWASGQAPYPNLPLVVLVDRFSASASEIVAACLQDHRRAIVVGERTYGKGTVQNVIPVEGGKSILRLTIASYWRPSGKNIHRLKTSEATDPWGVAPDPGFEIKLTDDERDAWLDYRHRRDVVQPAPPQPVEPPAQETQSDRDPALKKGLEYLRQKLTQPAPTRQTA
jgi:carboxyl-terminal processing protease